LKAPIFQCISNELEEKFPFSYGIISIEIWPFLSSSSKA
jgi:hypothetical protein